MSKIENIELATHFMISSIVNHVVANIKRGIFVKLIAPPKKYKPRKVTQRVSPLRNKHFTDEQMQCRFKNCKRRSGGPRYRFLCKNHRQ
jgi:hypothetical protein